MKILLKKKLVGPINSARTIAKRWMQIKKNLALSKRSLSIPIPKLAMILLKTSFEDIIY